MRKQTLAQVLATLLVGFIALVACVDDKYDLNDLDATMQVGKDGTLTLPSSSTGKITLGNLFEINEGSAIEKTSDGSYYVNTSGAANPTTIDVGLIKISKPSDQTFDATLDLRELISNAKRQAPAVGDGEPVAAFHYTYDISELAKAKIENAQATGISADVVEIKHVGLQTAEFKLEVEVAGENKEVLKELHFQNLKLHLPLGLVISSCKYEGQEVLTTDALKTIASKQGVIDISGNVGNTDYSLSATDPLTFTLQVEAAEVDAANAISFNASAHTANMQGSFNLEGEAVLTNEDLNVEVLTTLATEKFNETIAGLSDVEKAQKLADFATTLASGNYNEALSLVLPKLEFNGKSTFNTSDSQNMVINQFTGKIHREISKINPIELNDIPTFLQGDGISLDLDNPQIFLKLGLNYGSGASPFRENLKTSVRLEAYQDGVSTPTGVANSGEITFKGSDSKYIKDFGAEGDVMLMRIFSNTAATTVPVPSNMVPYISVIDHHAVPSLASLLTKVPNRVEVKGGATDNIAIDVDCESLQLPQNCTVSFDYQVYTPLSFGEKFSIVYTDTEDDWAKDMDDLKDLDFQALQMTAKMVSQEPVPLKMVLTLVPLDEKGAEINDISVSSVTIPANTTQQNISISIQPKSGHTMREFFQGSKGHKLNGIRYKAVMNEATKGQALKASQYITLEDVKISLIGGVTYYDKDKD